MGKEYEWAGYGPKYLKIRSVQTKSGISKFLCVKKERKGLEPLYKTIPEDVAGKREIVKCAEDYYSQWLSELAKPEAVKETEIQLQKDGKTIRELSAKIEELSKNLAPEYQRKVPYHMKRINEYMDIHCPLVTAFNANYWKAYTAFRRAAQPGCQLNHDRAQMNRILSYALEEGIISKKPKLKNSDSEAEGGRALEDGEIRAFYAHADELMSDAADLGFRMALRKIDILNLDDAKVDFKTNKIKFKRGLLSAEGGQKNKKPVEIEINPVCRAMLLRRAKIKTGKYFFADPEDPNKPMKADYFYKRWYATCKRAGVKSSPHDMRHTCATLMGRRGLPEGFTQKYCRMSARVIRDIYTHFQGQDNARAANMVVDDWGAK